MKGCFSNITIKGIKVVVPSKRIENNDYEKYIGKRRCKKQVRLTGVISRFVSNNSQNSVDLAYVAGKKLLEDIGWKPTEIDVMVFLTQNPMFVLPSSAFFLQKKLGLSNNCMVFDVNLGCTGAVEGIQIVASLLQNSIGSGKGLVLVADAVYEEDVSNSSEDDIANGMLFGSAGSAVGIERNDESGIISYFSNYSDGNRYHAIMRPYEGDLVMDGVAVFEFGVNDVSSGLIKFRKENDIKEDDIDVYSFHQAQKLMLDSIANTCGISAEKNLFSLERYGNTNGSSVLLNLCANRERVDSHDNCRILLCGFGVGLSWAYFYTELNGNVVQPIEYTDYCIE
ncbi:3-oxoacyl-ACP synthase III family protein [Anaerovibrio slackiae]|uniref:3-oxoacyl-ACP synthase III family protein n=1 Tax=Anaerovibrio slackiae TaxID=2652309 RepID=UPI003F18D18C